MTTTETKSKFRAKLVVAGEAATGKTIFSLQLARLLSSSWEKVQLIDATGQGAKIVQHPMLGPFTLETLQTEADLAAPDAWITAMRRAADRGIEAIVLDTASDEWDWCLAQKDRLGGKFQVWRQITPEHNRFVRAIMRSPMHVVSVLRRKEKFSMSPDPARRSEVTSIGLRSEMRRGFEKGMDLVIGLDATHSATIEHDKALLFPKGQPVAIRELAAKIKAWTEGEAPSGKRQ